MSFGRGSELFVPAWGFGNGFMLLAGQVLLFFGLEHFGVVIMNSTSVTPLHTPQACEWVREMNLP